MLTETPAILRNYELSRRGQHILRPETCSQLSLILVRFEDYTANTVTDTL